MKDILETIIKTLVDNKEAVSIDKVENENVVAFNVKVAKEDMGKIIGKEGKMAKAIRTVLKAIGTKEQKKVNVEFID